MIKGERRKNIPKEVTSVWEGSGWVLEVKPETVPVPPTPIPSPVVTEKTK
jgi:hypothetical protein